MVENNNSINFIDKYLLEYNLFIKQLIKIFPNEYTLLNIEKLDDSIKIDNGKIFNSLIDENNIILFINSKLKIFSHKFDNSLELSKSLFYDNSSSECKLYLKDILNNQSDDIKKVIWTFIHKLYIYIEKNKPPDQINFKYITLIDKLYNINLDEAKEKIHNLLDIDINDNTKDMIDDIVGSFDGILNNTSDNPLNCIMDISKCISEKYGDKINKGEIELDKIMKNIISKIPGMDNMPFDISSMVGKFNKDKKSDEKVIITDTFSTADVELGTLEESKSNIKISNILNMADQLGVIPGGKKNNKNSQLPDLGNMMSLINNLTNSISNNEKSDKHVESDINNMMNNLSNFLPNANNANNTNNDNINNDNNNNLPKLPDLGKMMNIMQKLTNSKTSGEDMSLLKNEMESFMKNDLKIDPTQFISK
jgi:hypothetical protein